MIIPPAEAILDEINQLFPEARCELNYRNHFELLCAVMLSAQTTDKSVNAVTPVLFARFPTAQALKDASVEEVENCIHRLGLYSTKARNLIRMAGELCERYNGIVPNDFAALQTLPGVGRKTANVVMAEGFGVPALAVDTHVERVSKRLGLVPQEASTRQTEDILCQLIPKERWIKAHHQLIFFGRYMCKSAHPQCQKCPFMEFCAYYQQHLPQ